MSLKSTLSILFHLLSHSGSLTYTVLWKLCFYLTNINQFYVFLFLYIVKGKGDSPFIPEKYDHIHPCAHKQSVQTGPGAITHSPEIFDFGPKDTEAAKVFSFFENFKDK